MSDERDYLTKIKIFSDDVARAGVTSFLVSNEKTIN